MDKKLQYGLTNSQLAVVEATQKEIIQIFDKEYTKAIDRKHHYTNLPAITRFSIARQFNRSKTVEQWRKWVQWYQGYRPDLISEEQQIINKLHTSGKYRFVGHDLNGNPVLLIRMRYHIKGMATVQQNLRYLLFMIQKGAKLAAEAGTYKLSVIYDRRNAQQSDEVSSKSMKKFMPILNDCYPQLLNAFYVLGANWLYKAMWAVVRIFISKRTQQKIHLLDEPQDLSKFISLNNLSDQYGGSLKISDSVRYIPIRPELDDHQDKQKLQQLKKQMQ